MRLSFLGATVGPYISLNKLFGLSICPQRVPILGSPSILAQKIDENHSGLKLGLEPRRPLCTVTPSHPTEEREAHNERDVDNNENFTQAPQASAEDGEGCIEGYVEDD